MPGPFRLRMRFHHWSVAVLLAFVLALTAIFLAVVIEKFNAMAEDGAQERFALIARSGAQAMQELIAHAGRQMLAHAKARASHFATEDGLNDREMLVAFLSHMESEDKLYSAYFALENDEFFQVVNVRNDPRIVQALAAQSAVALENHNLLEAQKALMDSMIQLVAGAIDAKSHYTGGHCERVPELAMMLAEEAVKATEGPLAEFRFETEAEWREFRIGAWLHDCGKVTTPEYVVDKATKLETLYNRIHEVRTRFEVLLRDAEIECLKAVRDGGNAAAAADRPYKNSKTLAESVKILPHFRKDQHIDPGLFDLFLRSGVYLRYAERFLQPGQIDHVDFGQYLAT